jgi:putative transposase
MPRGPRLDAKGVLHHVMVRGIEKRRIFRTNRDRQDLLDRLADIVPATGTAVYAWSLLPNHFHLLVRTGKAGLSRVMRRLLTGYAVSFNLRHKRAGRLFQNRFKSIVVEEEPYVLELVRYIHLNPLRVGLVKNVGELSGYRWSGHATLVGAMERPWQDVQYVLERFGTTVGEARQAYCEFVVDGVSEGRREDLVGGGLVRSIGGRQNIPELRRGRERWAFDERVLGRSEFVVGLLEGEEAARERREMTAPERKRALDRLISFAGRQTGLRTEEVVSGSRRRHVVRCRGIIGYLAVCELGIPASEVGRSLGVSVQSILRVLDPGRRVCTERGWSASKLCKKRE